MISNRLIYIIPLFLGINAFAEIVPENPGRILFSKLGCTNCHGQNGIHPTSKYAPVLRGKSSSYIIEKASAIFSGKYLSDRTYFMHEQFCVGDIKKDDSCYPIPTEGELKKIAQWLSSNLPDRKMIFQGLFVSAQDTHDKLQDLGDKALFIDIRTRAEVAFLGMPTDVDANIPYMIVGNFSEWNEKKQNFKFYPNSKFTLQFDKFVKSRELNKDSLIFLICRSGKRSARAVKLLSAIGYNNVYSVVHGFEGDKAKKGLRKGERIVNGWKNKGLPWSYKLNKKTMYMEI